MAISYPINTPTNIGIANITLMAENAVAISHSPFTFQQQVVAHPGQRWAASISLPPMKRQDAEYWVTFLLSLKGQVGTFLLGDPLGSQPRGSGGGTSRIKGGSQTGEDINIDGCTPDITGWLKAGDYIQIGSDAVATLHKVLVDADTNGSGETTLSLWPHVRAAPSDNTLVIYNNAVGRWRLSSNMTQWSINEISSYGITFDCVEAI